ncbi:PP2C family protein-serine/threonine phosphatase [Pelosinus sp. UFO1]|uniref:PP2C family protein-serine/threonine phosphatase n=1 Tax=Pelosinus sp. UFO1 TaxID=484770 RepID=UPI0004D0FF7B|nr:fused response regulator/phosphatase [Pelosinus sp. UFO1]AIF51075.1 response regulator receiver modulated serine phosphatase [Pelosinus sp. UFO1]
MGYNILIVDDVLFNRTILREALKGMEEVTFTDAENGMQALDIIAGQEISLIILDLMMPLKDGFEVLHDMKQEKDFKDIPVIVYSAIDDIDSISKALTLGAYDYFTKPLKPKEMNVILPMKVKNALISYDQQKTIRTLNEKMKLELLMANLFQQSMLKEKQDMSSATMYGKYIPSQEIGGDFYESFQIGEDTWFIMADVSGYGVSAAMLSSMLKVEFHHCAQFIQSPEKVLKWMNQTFYKITQSNYSLTAFVGKIHENTLFYSNAGQPYPMVFRVKDKTVQILRESNFPLGMEDNEAYNLHNIELESDDIIMTYTDGLLEDRSFKDSLGVYDDLANNFITYQQIIKENPSDFFDIIFKLFGNVQNEEVNHDMAIMLICMK